VIPPCILVVASEPAIAHPQYNAFGQFLRAEESQIGAEANARVQRNPIPALVFLELGGGEGDDLQPSHSDLKV
jgi:hypothetical protein